MADEPQEPGATGEEEQSAAALAALRRATARPATSRPARHRPAAASYADGRDPQLVGDAVERLVRDQGWTDQAAVAVLMGDWAAVVGPGLADHVVPVSFADGELTLAADSTSWATQVRLLLPQVHRAVDARVGEGVVARIRIQGPQGPTWTAGPRRVPGRGPRDTYG